MSQTGRYIPLIAIITAVIVLILSLYLFKDRNAFGPSTRTEVLAQEQKFIAFLSEDQEVPSLISDFSRVNGSAWFKPMDGKVGYQVNVSGLDRVNMVYIHGGKSGENGDPIAMLQIKQSVGRIKGTLAKGNITSSDLMGSLTGKTVSDLISEMQSGDTYVNVHTETNPFGLIRGQISVANNLTG
jgi:CHRD domain